MDLFKKIKKPDKIICSQCNSENPKMAKFCQNCGCKFIICNSCNSINSINQKYCLKCGESIEKNAFMIKGMDFYKTEDYFNASLFFEKIINNYPKDSQASLYLGYSLFNLKEYEKSLIYLNICLKIEPNNLELLEKKRIIMEKFNQYNEVINCCNQMYIIHFKQKTDNSVGLTSKEKKLIKKIKDALDSSGNLIYIENFIKRYGILPRKENLIELNIKENIVKLRTLLKSKDIEINYETLFWLLWLQSDLIEYEELENKILNNNPQNINEFVSNFVEIFGNQYDEKNYQYFKIILQQKEIDYTEEQLIELINKYKSQKEIQLFEQNLTFTENQSFFTINDIDYLDGPSFENFLELLFIKMGYEAMTTPISGDQGADLIISKFGEKTVVQAKRYNEKVSNKAVQEVVSSIAYYNANKAMVVTNSEFTKSAIELAKVNNIQLIDRKTLINFLNQYKIKK